MPAMIPTLLIVWGVLLALLIVLLIYRSTLTIHEDDQLFLADSEGYLKEEQDGVQRRMGKLAPFVRVAQIGTGLVTVLICAIWLWDAYKRF